MFLSDENSDELVAAKSQTVSIPKPVETETPDETEEEEEEESMRLYLEPDSEQPEDEIILSSQKTPAETTVSEKSRLVFLAQKSFY